MSEFEPISAVPLREHVYQRLQEMLIARTFAPGDRLPEETIAQQLGVSRGPVREALQRLQRDGWVTLRPRYGAFVHQPTPEQIDEFFEARELVEGSAAVFAAQRATAEDAEALLQICDEATADLRRGVAPELMAAHTARFHLMVLRSAGNHVLLEFGEQLALRSRWFFAPLVASIAPRAWAEHRHIAERITAGQAAEAGQAMRSHTQWSRRAYVELQHPGPGAASARKAARTSSAARHR